MAGLSGGKSLGMKRDGFTKEELACVDAVESAPKGEKELVFKEVCGGIVKKSRLAILALALGLPSPVFAEDGNTTRFDPGAGYSQVEKFGKDTPQFLQDYLNGKTGNMVIGVEFLQAGNDLNRDLDFMLGSLSETVPDGKKMQVNIKDKASYEEFVSQIFVDSKDPSKVSKWLKQGENKSQAGDKAVNDYVSSSGRIERRWKSIYAKWDKQITSGVLNAKVYDDVNKMVNDGMNKLIFNSCEARRLLFVTAASLAYIQNINPNTEEGRKILDAQATDTSTNAVWYTLLTNNNGNHYNITKYEITGSTGTTEKTSQMGNQDLKKAGLPQFNDSGVYAANKMDIFYRGEVDYSQVLKRLAKADERLAKADERLAKADKEGERIAKEGELGRSIITIGNEAISITEDVKKLAVLLNTTQDEQIKSSIQETLSQKVARLKEIRSTLEKLLKDPANNQGTIKAIQVTLDFMKKHANV
ncbi:MAG: hypothetical protein PHE25_02480 [Candidatus Gracilibacteria bacterium]|nr:hypothetical protein [Candidatus Gracilibacteria bacterium]